MARAVGVSSRVGHGEAAASYLQPHRTDQLARLLVFLQTLFVTRFADCHERSSLRTHARVAFSTTHLSARATLTISADPSRHASRILRGCTRAPPRMEKPWRP
jgi:hypothetical protein